MRTAPLIALAAALLAAAPASARPARDRVPSPWATVNVCDTALHPNRIGIRGAMPGLARRTRMVMRFRVQYRDATGRWRFVPEPTDGRWIRVATARRGWHDYGWTFAFKPPASGGALVLRGHVAFQWRRDGRVVRRARRVTAAGHPGTAGADPADFSAATCAVA